MLEAESKKIDLELVAEGQAAATVAAAEASAAAVERLARALGSTGGSEAVSVRLAEQYVAAFGELAKEGNTVIVPASAADPAGMVAGAMGIYQNLQKQGDRKPLGLPALGGLGGVGGAGGGGQTVSPAARLRLQSERGGGGGI